MIVSSRTTRIFKMSNNVFQKFPVKCNKPRIKIKNFGAIKETSPKNDGWIDIDKVTVFIGNQGSGKSTIAKLISTFVWIEKALVRGDYDDKYFQRKGKFTALLKYHRLETYSHTDSYIEYQGHSKIIIFENNQLYIEDSFSNSQYVLPQIMYVPAERNFISYVKNAKELRISSESMQEFVTEFNKAKQAIKHPFELPIDNTHLEYDRLNDKLNLKGSDYKIQLSDGSSGFQSAVPLLLVSDYLAKSISYSKNDTPMSEKERENFSKEMKLILENNDFSDEQRRLAISLLSNKFNKKSFINIVEEPEQNLFPNSQWEILKELLRFNSENDHNHLLLTTHSPYIINYLSIAVKAGQIFSELPETVFNNIEDEIQSFIEHERLTPNTPSHSELEEEIGLEISKIIPAYAWLDSSELSIYQLKDGIAELLPEIYGIPSDDNYLNNMLAEGNELVDKLMELEDDYTHREFL